MQDILTIGIPVFAILTGILCNRNDTKDLRGALQAFRAEGNGRFSKVGDHLGRIDADLRQFYHRTGKLEARMDALRKSHSRRFPTARFSFCRVPWHMN